MAIGADLARDADDLLLPGNALPNVGLANSLRQLTMREIRQSLFVAFSFGSRARSG